MGSPPARSSASSVWPSVARMNLALAFVVAGLSRSAARVAPTVPGAHTARRIWLRWSTPPGTSDALLLPARRRLRVVSLLPKAARKANGNSCLSKDWGAHSCLRSVGRRVAQFVLGDPGHHRAQSGAYHFDAVLGGVAAAGGHARVVQAAFLDEH